jgi:signal peptidase I
VTSEDRDLSIFEGSRSSVSPAKPRGLPAWAETLVLLAVALVIAIVVKSLFVQAYYVPSQSMEPLLQGGPGVKTDDRILVEKVSYWLGHSPSRGDVVVFKDPGGWLDAEEADEHVGPVTKVLTDIGLVPSGGHLVKRVIGVAGDVIHCCNQAGELEVNGHAIDESSYAVPGKLDGHDCYGPMPGTCDWTAGPVPKGYLFVMGDNRAHSADSSYHLCLPSETECHDSPYVPVRDVVGKVVALFWPLGRMRLIHRPADFAGIPPARVTASGSTA